MPMDGVKTDSAVRQFWDKYIILLGKQAIKPAQQRWFVRRAEAYIAHYAEHKLATHSPEQAEPKGSDSIESIYSSSAIGN